MDSEGTSLRYCGREECGINLKLKSTLTLQEQDNINARTWKDFFFCFDTGSSRVRIWRDAFGKFTR